MSRYAPIRVRQVPPLGWAQTILRPDNPRVRREMRGLHLSTPVSGGLDYLGKGTRQQNQVDGLLLSNGSLLLSLLGKKVECALAEPGSPLQPYASASAGISGGYLQIPRSLGRSGIASGTQATVAAGIFLGRSVQLEYGYQYSSKMRGVNLSGSYTSFHIRF
jgi:hypothetical protein